MFRSENIDLGLYSGPDVSLSTSGPIIYKTKRDLIGDDSKRVNRSTRNSEPISINIRSFSETHKAFAKSPLLSFSQNIMSPTTTRKSFYSQKSNEPESSIDISDVRYPLFCKFNMLDDDKYWSQIYKDACCGTFPDDISYSNGFIGCVRRKKQLSIRLVATPESSDQVLINEMIKFKDFLKTYANIRSPNDLKTAYDNAMTNHTEKQWSDITKSNLTSVLINRYITSYCEEHNLTQEQVKDFKLKVMHGITSKRIPNNYVHFNGYNRVTKIDGIKWDPERNGYVYTDKYLPPHSKFVQTDEYFNPDEKMIHHTYPKSKYAKKWKKVVGYMEQYANRNI